MVGPRADGFPWTKFHEKNAKKYAEANPRGQKRGRADPRMNFFTVSTQVAKKRITTRTRIRANTNHAKDALIIPFFGPDDPI